MIPQNLKDRFLKRLADANATISASGNGGCFDILSPFISKKEFLSLIQGANFLFSNLITSEPPKENPRVFYFESGFYENKQGELYVLPREIAFVFSENILSSLNVELIFFERSVANKPFNLSLLALQPQATVEISTITAYLTKESANNHFLLMQYRNSDGGIAYRCYMMVGDDIKSIEVYDFKDISPKIASELRLLFEAERKFDQMPKTLKKVDDTTLSTIVITALVKSGVPLYAQKITPELKSTTVKSASLGIRVDRFSEGVIEKKYIQQISSEKSSDFLPLAKSGAEFLHFISKKSPYFLDTYYQEIPSKGFSIFIADYSEIGNLSTAIKDDDFRKKILYSREILEALAIMHDSGRTHNDLKSENILVFPNNTIKIFDADTVKSPLSEIYEEYTLFDAGTRVNYSPRLLGLFYHYLGEMFVSQEINEQSETMQWVRENRLNFIRELFDIPEESPNPIAHFESIFSEYGCAFPSEFSDDVWAAGLIIYELFTGYKFIKQKRPFMLEEFINLPSPLSAMLKGLLAWDHRERWSSKFSLDHLLKHEELILIENSMKKEKTIITSQIRSQKCTDTKSICGSDKHEKYKIKASSIKEGTI